MIKRIKNGLSKRKVQIFLLSLLCSGLAWFISNLSESYTNRAVFEIEYTNTPDSLLLTKVFKDKIEVKLKASGFQFLGFGFSHKKVKVDLSALEKADSKYFVPQSSYVRQIERQLSSSMTLLEIDRDTLFFDFHKIYSKEVPVRPKVEIQMAQNYLLDGKLIIEPNVVTITGPKNEIDTIDMVETQAMIFPDLTSNFSRTLNLDMPLTLKNTVLSLRAVQVSGKVSRFSEKIIDVPVQVINLPQGTKIKTFPNVVSILCKAKIDRLKNLNATDFQLIVDYSSLEGNSAKTLPIELKEKPTDIHSARLLENQVEFILRRE